MSHFSVISSWDWKQTRTEQKPELFGLDQTNQPHRTETDGPRAKSAWEVRSSAYRSSTSIYPGLDKTDATRRLRPINLQSQNNHDPLTRKRINTSLLYERYKLFIFLLIICCFIMWATCGLKCKVITTSLSNSHLYESEIDSLTLGFWRHLLALIYT